MGGVSKNLQMSFKTITVNNSDNCLYCLSLLLRSIYIDQKREDSLGGAYRVQDQYLRGTAGPTLRQLSVEFRIIISSYIFL